MNRKYLNIGIAIALTYSGVRYERQYATARAAEPRPLSRSASGPNGAASGDTATGTKLIGKVTFAGQPPKGRAINMASDPACSKAHPGTTASEELVTGSDNAVANVLVYVSEGLGGRAFDAPQQPAVIEQKGCLYHPHVVALEIGQKLLVENSDPTIHNIHPQPSNNREWNQSQAQGVPPIEATFGREEVAIPVKCNIHPWMKGYIAVFKHPFFAVTDKDGKFVLKDVPPGNYTLTAWHEQLGTVTQKVTIAANETKEVSFLIEVQANH